MNKHQATAATTKPTPNTTQLPTRVKGELARRQRLMRKYQKNYRLIAVILVIVVACIIGYFVSLNLRAGPIPKSIENSVTFAIFYPNTSKQIVIKQSSFQYNKTKGQIVFGIVFNNQKITFAEQASPDSFSADPNFYQDLVTSLNGYATFDSINGQVNLTLPTQTKEQTAIMNAKGTLLFASTTSKITEGNWRLLFNSMNNTQP